MQHTATGWWIEEAGGSPEAAPPLEGPLDADVVVIGGGYLGMWTAWQLLERDPKAEVVVLEAGQAGHGPSDRNGGFVNGYWEYVPELAGTYGLDPALELARQADRSILEIGEFCRSQKVDAWYHQAPHLEVSAAPYQDGAWRDALWGLSRLGIDEELVELLPEQVDQLCFSPVFRGGAWKRIGATVQPARLAFGLRAALLRRGVKLYEHSEVGEIDQSEHSITVRTDRGRVHARNAVLAVNWRTSRWPAFSREISVASSHIVLTEPVPDVIEEIGWTGGEAITDCQKMIHYFRTTRDGRIAFGWGGGRVAPRGFHSPALHVDPEVVERTAATMRRFFPALEGREVTDAWGGPIDVAPRTLPIYRSSGRLHAGWGFTGHGVGPSHLGGKILSGLALGVDDEFTRLPLVEPRVKAFPPEPARSIGGNLIRAAMIRREDAQAQGRRVDPVTGIISELPRLVGLNLPR